MADDSASAYRVGVDSLLLADGRTVSLGERAAGGSKNETRFGRLEGASVVVKVEGAHGRLQDEARALCFLAAQHVRVPHVVALATTTTGQRVLVITREPGARTVTPDGWRRFGHDLAALLGVRIDGCPLPRVTTERFVADHRQRLDVICPLIGDGLSHEIDRAITAIAGETRLVVTHGDPGSGNYLDDPSGHGTLLDWETATVSPSGLDLGRAAFIGLLDLGASGVPEQLVGALIDGYRDAQPSNARMSDELLHAWIIVGGLQFIHDRHVRPLRPERTSEVAAEVLRRYLGDR